ncbi:hypothetical protein [Archangium sp.]|uniref:hypothetical protein n=1 Tax=Archangium sp. TaxID=1872627 RepID=UPI002869F77D|nr:hypothetical protein [Archangium sp.]
MSELPQGRRPTPRITRPLLLASAGVALVKIACGTAISGNLVAPPPCDESNKNDPYCVDVDAGTDGGTQDGGTSDGGR